MTGKAQLFIPNPQVKVIKHQKMELQEDLDEKVEQLEDLRIQAMNSMAVTSKILDKEEQVK